MFFSEIRRNYGRWLIFFAWLLITAIGIYFHEPWRDEGQAWLLARDLSWGQIFMHTGIEGHPFLWFYILKPFTKLPFYPTISIINYIATAAGIYLLLFKLRFPLWFSCALMFSPILIYEYPVIARNYGLSFTLLVWILAIHESEKYMSLRTVLLGLSMNVMVSSMLVAFAYWFFFWYEKIGLRKDLPAAKKKSMDCSFYLGLPFLGAAIVQIFLMFIHRTSLGKIFSFLPIHAVYGALLVVLALAIAYNFLAYFPLPPYKFQHKFQSWYLQMSFITLGLVVIISSYGLSMRHLFIVCLYAYFLLAAVLENRQKILQYCLGFSVLLFVTLYSDMYRMFYQDIFEDYSGSVKAVEYIKKAGWNDKSRFLMLAYHSPWIGAIAPYFPPQTFYLLEKGDYGSFTDWTEYYELLKKNPQPLPPGDKEVIYISAQESPGEDWESIAIFQGIAETIEFFKKKTT